METKVSKLVSPFHCYNVFSNCQILSELFIHCFFFPYIFPTFWSETNIKVRYFSPHFLLFWLLRFNWIKFLQYGAQSLGPVSSIRLRCNSVRQVKISEINNVFPSLTSWKMLLECLKAWNGLLHTGHTGSNTFLLPAGSHHHSGTEGGAVFRCLQKTKKFISIF